MVFTIGWGLSFIFLPRRLADPNIKAQAPSRPKVIAAQFPSWQVTRQQTPGAAAGARKESCLSPLQVQGIRSPCHCLVTTAIGLTPCIGSRQVVDLQFHIHARYLSEAYTPEYLEFTNCTRILIYLHDQGLSYPDGGDFSLAKRGRANLEPPEI